MPPLTSPAGCGSCFRLTQQSSELQERISILYQIRDEEGIMDSPVTVGCAATTTATSELDSIVPCLDTAAAQAADHWAQLGAKPKFPVSSAPSRREPWTAAGRGNHGGKLLARPYPPQDLQLSNKFSILDERDFPPLGGHRTPPSSPM